MYALMVILIVMTLLIGLFTAAIAIKDVIIEEKERRKKKNVPQPVVTEEKPVCPHFEMPQASAEIAVSEDEESAQTESEELEGNVAFSAGSQSLEEKYLELAPECKGYYDEIVRSAMAVEGSKRYKNSAYEEYKVGKNRLVRLKIKRGVVVCELVIPNLAFKNYISGSKVAMKQAPATIKVLDEASLNAVKDSIGIAVSAIEEEKAYKKEQARLRRKELRAKANEKKEESAE